ncbi:MAG: hypothetical protein GPOALKHO_000994 [Sodalis sp.]|nr:MAG: hypothetical protein GPOALKHO_000994 [Sodalis sp.]
MTKRLTSKDILALGFMIFALFVGAGNIIFPPMVGRLQSGQHVWLAAAGFLITAVGLPVMAVIALARVGGGIDALSSPIGRKAGLFLAVVCYLAVGPLFATPRTATVSFAVGVAPFAGNGELPLLIYSLIYFQWSSVFPCTQAAFWIQWAMFWRRLGSSRSRYWALRRCCVQRVSRC